MENKYHNIDEIFRNSLEGYSADPPARVWENIDSALDKLDGKRKSRFMWFMGSFLAVATAFVGGYYLSGYLSKDVAPIAENNAPSTEAPRVNTSAVQFPEERVIAMLNEKITSRMEVPVYTHHTVVHHTATVTHTADANTQNTDVQNGNTGSVNTNTLHTTTTTGSNLGTNDTQHNDSGYFSPGGGNTGNNHNAPVKRVNENESADSLKKNSLSDVNTDKTRSFLKDSRLNDKEKSELMAQLKDRTNTGQQDNITQSTAPSTTTTSTTVRKEQVDKIDEDFAFLTSDYPVITVMPYFAPMYTLQNSQNSVVHNSAFGSGTAFDEKPTFSYSTGLLLGYNFTKRLTVFIGCGYNQFSTTTSRSNLQTTQLAAGDSTGDFYTSSGMINGMTLNVPTNESIPPYISTESGMSQPIKTITQTFGFVEVPVLVRYKFFGERRVGMTLTGGLSTGFLVRNDVYASNDNERIQVGNTDKLRNFSLNAQVGVGMEVEILPWMYFNFEPTFRYSFLNWSTDEKVKMNPLYFSANTGFSFKF